MNTSPAVFLPAIVKEELDLDCDDVPEISLHPASYQLTPLADTGQHEAFAETSAMDIGTKTTKDISTESSFGHKRPTNHEVCDGSNIQSPTNTEPTTLSCTHCNSIFTNRNDLIGHSETHAVEKQHQCDYCNKRFAYKRNLILHATIHLKETPFICSPCNRGFLNQHHLNMHAQMHQRKNVFSESIKLSSFNFPLTSETQAKPVVEKPYPSNYCSERFTYKGDLTAHTMAHLRQTPYFCPSCNREFSTKYYFTAHMQTHLAEKPNSCSESVKSLPSNSYLNSQAKPIVDKPYPCNYCGNRFIQVTDLILHTSTFHSNGEVLTKQNLTAQAHEEENSIPSSKSFRLPASYPHLTSHDLADPIKDKPYPNSGSDYFRSLYINVTSHKVTELTAAKSYPCNYCGKILKCKSRLTEHERVHTKEKPFVCSECGKDFKQSYSLTVHTRKHTGIRPFACSECKKTFIGKRYLHSHKCSPQNPYQCKDCDKSFALESNLNAHTYEHSVGRLFTCSYCSKAFTKKGYLKTHFVTHTGIGLHPCPYCRRGFTQKVNMKKHALKCEKQNTPSV